MIAHACFQEMYGRAQMLNRAEQYRQIHGDAFIDQCEGVEIGPDGKLRVTSEPAFEIVQKDRPERPERRQPGVN